MYLIYIIDIVFKMHKKKSWIDIDEIYQRWFSCYKNQRMFDVWSATSKKDIIFY